MTVSATRWAEIVGLLRASGLPTEDLARETHADRFVTIEAEGALLGCAAVERYDAPSAGSGRAAGLLRSVAVAEAARGMGLGARLVAEAEAKARAEGIGALYLLTTTAAPFFEARGYVPTDRAAVPEAVRRSAEFCSMCPASAACLGKQISP